MEILVERIKWHVLLFWTGRIKSAISCLITVCMTDSLLVHRMRQHLPKDWGMWISDWGRDTRDEVMALLDKLDTVVNFHFCHHAWSCCGIKCLLYKPPFCGTFLTRQTLLHFLVWNSSDDGSFLSFKDSCLKHLEEVGKFIVI